LLNMGGPDSREDVRPYLRNIFSDPAILDIPLGFALRPLLARIIAKRREPTSVGRYELIGGSTPLNPIARRQAVALEDELGRRGLDARVSPGMRYWHPFTHESIEEWSGDGMERLIGLSMYPQYCAATSGSSLDDFRRHARRIVPESGIHEIGEWHLLPAYVELMAERIDAAFGALTPDEQKSCCVLFSAHSVPQRLVDRGDPYERQSVATQQAVVDRLQTQPRTELAFQSAVGPVKWLEPDSKDAVSRLAEEGIKALIAVPLGFVAENIETLWDIELDLFSHARECGIEHCVRIECPNAHPAFIAGLADLVTEALRGGETT
jgi:protoporphyrin/coproporphyrin ferrochelatase